MDEKDNESLKKYGLTFDKLSDEQRQALLESWGYKSRSDAYDTMAGYATKIGKGTTTPGKYGVFVGDPMGAFASGAMGSYAMGSKLADALRTTDTFKNLGKPAVGTQQMPNVPAPDTSLAQTYAANPPANPMQNAQPIPDAQGLVTLPNGRKVSMEEYQYQMSMQR
jgi:hypothetical protein